MDLRRGEVRTFENQRCGSWDAVTKTYSLILLLLLNRLINSPPPPQFSSPSSAFSGVILGKLQASATTFLIFEVGFNFKFFDHWIKGRIFFFFFNKGVFAFFPLFQPDTISLPPPSHHWLAEKLSGFGGHTAHVFSRD